MVQRHMDGWTVARMEGLKKGRREDDMKVPRFSIHYLLKVSERWETDRLMGRNVTLIY